MKFALVATRDIKQFIPVLREVELGDRFLLSILHWCGIGPRTVELPFWKVFLGRKNKTPVGVCGLYRNHGMRENLVWLAWLGIRRPFRRSGLGTEMLSNLIATARSEFQVSEVWVYTDANDIGIHRFYERIGFNFIGEGRTVAPEVVISPSDKVFCLKLRGT